MRTCKALWPVLMKNFLRYRTVHENSRQLNVLLAKTCSLQTALAIAKFCEFNPWSVHRHGESGQVRDVDPFSAVRQQQTVFVCMNDSDKLAAAQVKFACYTILVF